MRRTPATFAQALAQLSERPTPALIWRNGDERVELSGRVLVNWVEKSASLLVDELDVESGQLITVSPRQHWRLVVLTLAALRVGAAVRFGENSADDAAVHAALEGHLNDGVPAEHVLAVASRPWPSRVRKMFRIRSSTSAPKSDHFRTRTWEWKHLRTAMMPCQRPESRTVSCWGSRASGVGGRGPHRVCAVEKRLERTCPVDHFGTALARRRCVADRKRVGCYAGCPGAGEGGPVVGRVRDQTDRLDSDGQFRLRSGWAGRPNRCESGMRRPSPGGPSRPCAAPRGSDR